MANITVDIQARVTGYQKSLSDLQSQIQKLDPGASISKNVTKAFEQASNEVKGLSKNMFPKASSDTQIDAIVEKANHAGEAIQNVVRLLQQVTVNDLNFGNFGTEIDSFRSQIAALEQDLNTKLNQGLLSAVQGSQQLKDVFAGLGTDLSKADANTLFQDLSKGAQDAAGEVKKAQAEVDAIEKKLNDTQLSLNKNKQSILATQEGRMNLDTEIKGISDSYNNIFDSLRNTMEKGLSSALKGQNIDTKGMLDTFFKDLTPENIKGRIQNLFSQLSGSFNGAREFYKAVFGADGKAGSNINNLVNAIDLRGSIEAVKAQFQEFIAQNGGLIKPDQLPKITRLIDTDSINEAVQKTINEFDSAFGRVQKAIQEGQEKLVTQTESRDMAQKALIEAQTRQSNYDTAITNLQTELDKVKAENENLVKQIEDLRASMEQQKGSTLEGFKSTAGAIGQSARQNVFPTDEANAYKQQLDQVTAKEQALGKLQGVVQRWFSVYAAIRMVRQAIDSVISTVQELDATITEIAIVTSMDQSELWDQMPKYTQLARDYAASISGVYQVSQLYYQQGLQTADVMALTEQTLKMARISGLDYAQATDYMTNAVRSFKMEMTDAQRVVDVYSSIAASSATSVTELASAMSKTASSAQAVGSSFENTTAMMAVMIEATRESAENIGSAMKSIISRYGEMTSDPSKLMDSEGQEMSLNRVDKALQTVGISIHNAAGEFRNFDEVIMELAQKWNTIDTNTQRYIATIMAGNRQQSRFLALVSSYDRLKELSAEAAESEDASQLQFLKTLDSVEAKTQQFQTSVQALYVNSGIEDLYKGILDWANKVIISLDQLSDKFGLLASVGKVSATFTSLATLVTNLFTVIKMSFSRTRAQISAEAELEAANRTLAEESAMNRITNAYEKEKIDYQNNQQQMTEASKTESQKRVEIAQNEVKKTQSSLLSSKTMRSKAWGMGASALGLVATTLGASMDANTQRQEKAWATGIGSALSGIGTGFMIGGGWGAIIGALTALPGIIEAIGLSSETTAEKVSRLQNTLTEATNARIKSQDELKTLTDYKKKYEEVYAARNNSNEAYEEYIKLNQEIATAYPTLISGMDEEGNYLVELADGYESLLAIKQQVYNADFVKEGKAQIQSYGDRDTLLSLYGYKSLGKYINSPLESYSGLIESDNLIGLLSHQMEQMSSYDLSNKSYSEILSEAFSSAWGKENLSSMMEVLAITSTSDINKIFSGYNDIEAIKDLSTLYNRGLQHSEIQFNGIYGQTAQLITDLLFTTGKILDDTNGDIKKVNEQLSGIFGTNITFNSDLLGNIAELKAIMPTMQEAQEKIIKSLNISAVSNSIKSLNLEVDSLSQDWIDDSIVNEWENFRKTLPDNTDLADAWSIFILSMDDMVQEAYSSFDFYKDLTTDQTNQIKSLYKNSKDYSIDQMASSLDELNIVNEDLREFILSSVIEDSQFLIDQFKTGFAEKMAANKITTINGTSVDSLAADFSSKFGVSFLSNILNHYDTILSNTNLTAQAKSSLLDTLTTLYTSIQDNTEFTLQEQIQLLSIINNADLTSSNEIDSLIKTIENKGIDINETPFLANLITFSESLIPNISAEIQTYFSSIESASEDYLKAISSAEKGMDLNTAKEMANKLGKTLNDFRIEQGKFYYDNYNDLREVYLGENIEKENELIQLTLDKYQTISNFSEKLWNDINTGSISVTDLEKIIDQNQEFDNTSLINASTLSDNYKKYKDELINGTINESVSFLKYLTNQIHKEFQDNGAATSEYITQNVAIAQIKAGDMHGFIQTSGLMEEAITAAEQEVFAQYAESRAEALANEAVTWNQQLEDELLSQAKSEAPESYYQQAELDLIKAGGISESELNAIAEALLQRNQNQLNTILEEEENRDFQAEAEDKWIQNGGTSLEDIEKEAKRLNDRDFTEGESIQLEEYYQRFNDNVEEAENAFIQDRLSQLYTSRAEQIAQIKADLIQQSTDRIQKAQENATWDASLYEASEEWEAIYNHDMVRERAQQLANEAKAFNKQMENAAQWKPTDTEFYMAQAMKEIKQEQDAAIQAQAEQWAQAQIDLAKEGRFSEIESDTVKQHAALIYDTYHSINESIANSIISAIGDSEGLIKVTETNQDTLEKLKREHPDWLKGEATVDSYITITAEKLLNNAQQFEQFIAASFNTNADRIKALTDVHKNQYANSRVENYGKVAGTESFAYEDLLNYINESYGFEFLDEISIEDKIAELGLAFDSMGNVIIENYDLWIGELESEVKVLASNGANQQELNHAQALLEQTKHVQEQAIASGFDGILKDYSNISVESIEALANALGVSYEHILSYLTSNGNGTYQLDTSKLPVLLSELTGKVSQATVEAIEKSISSIGDTYLSNIKNAASYTTKGASSLADIEVFKQSYTDITGQVLDESAFQYNTLTQSFVLDPAAMSKYVDAQKELLIRMGYTEEFVNTYIVDQTDKAIQAGIELDGFFNADSSKSKNDEANKLFQQIQNLSNYYDIAKQAAVKYFGHTVDSTEEEFEAIISVLSNGGQAAVDLLQQIKPNASAEELGSVYSNAINRLNDALTNAEDFIVGSMVNTTSKLYQVLTRVNPNGVNADGVITAAYDMVEVYAAIYAEMSVTQGRTTAGLNEAYAKLLTAADQQEIDAIEMLSNAQGMTYDALGQMLSKYNQSLEEWMSNPDYYGITAIGAGKIRITDWESFSSGLGLVGGTEEYIDAYKSFNDGVIEQNKKIKENIKSEINSIKDANPFDEINLTQMWATYGEALELALNDTNLGAIFHNGILTLTEDAKIPDILQRVGQVAASAGDLIPSELAELSDAIASFLENLTDLISQGISGGLSHVDKNNLIEQARSQLGIDDLEFVQTADGFQLVETSALKLYDALKKVNSFAAGKLFEGLKEQLEEVNENFESSSALTAYISNTRQDILNTDNKVSNARKEQYEEELKIAKEILAVRATSEDDSFNFMNQDIPAGQNNPLNYMASWKTAFDSIKQAKRSGSMDYKDFYNFVTEVGHLAEITGKAIPLGKKSVENSQQAADLITQAASQLKIVEKDGSYKINLSGLKQFGIDFAAGAQGMADGIDEGIHQMAQSQIDMLDGMIQLLETIVAMEKLGDIASGGDKDNVIDLHDILPEIKWDEQGNLIDIGKYAEDYKTIIQQIKDAAKENEDLAKGLKNTKINGFSLETIFGWSEEDMAKQGKDFMTGYAAYLQAMSQAALSGNYNEDDVANSIKQVLAESGATDFTIDTGKISIIFSGGEVTTIDWTDQAVKEIVDKYAKGSTEEAAHEKVQAALAKYTAGEGAGELTLEEILTLQHKLTILDDGTESVTITAGGKTETYTSTSADWTGALSAETLENLGYTDNEITIDGETAKTTTTIGNQTDIKVECTNGVVKVSGTGPSPDGKSSIPVEGSNIREWQDNYVDAYIKAAEKVAPEKAKWTREQILWQELGIRVNTTTRVVDEKGRDYDINNDPAMRERLKELQGKSPEQLKDKINDLENGNIEVELDNGVKAIIDGASIEWDVKNKTYNQEKFDKQISNMLGLDTILQENIAGGITKGFESLSTTLEGLNAEPATNVANAIQLIGTNATTALTEVSNLVAELEKLNTLQLPSNSNNSNAPKPGKEKLTAKQYADKYGKGTIASGGLSDVSGGAKTSTENTITDSSTVYTIKVDKVQIDTSGASASIAPGTHVKVADDSKVDIENSIMGVPSSLDPLDMTYIPKDLGQQQVPTGMSMTITNPIKAKVTTIEPILEEAEIKTEGETIEIPVELNADNLINDAENVGANVSDAVANGIRSGESNIQNAIGSIETHIRELNTMATDVFEKLRTLLQSIQGHVSITGDVTLETPFGTLSSTSGVKATNGKITLSVEGIEKVEAAKESIGKPVSFTVTAVDLASSVIAKIANNLSKLTSKTIEITTNYTTTGRPPKTNGMTELPKATGNVGLAQAKGTLMGELGPELVVSNGRYFVAGQNGAEMVDLADDAIVFNHLQTEQLLKHGMSSGRGRAVTSERNAVAFAQGNVDGGPAMASASAALNALKQLRAMWESLLGASVSDLGKGGGGGGGGSKVIDPKAWIDTVERWYNLMQEIARLEQQITHEEKLRAKLQSDFQKNGKAYYTSQKLSLDSLEQQIQAQEQLNLSREDYLDRRVAALKENSFGKIYQFDPETNQLEFRKDTNLNGFTNAMEFLTDLYGFNEQGKANYTNKQKYEILKANGFGEQMLYKDGMEIKADSDNSGDISDEEWESFYEQATEAFRDRMDEYAQATQSLRDEIQKGKDQLLELQTQVNEILQDMRDNQMDVENKVLDAIVDLREREIDALQDERDKLEESVNKYVDGLSNALDKEQKMYQNQESQNDLDKQRRRLAILQRSGGSASDIANLQNDINQSERDMYFDLQQQQIDAIQEASQLELERMDTQIEIMNETLEFQKEYGLLWGEVYNVMSGSAAQITDFISGNSEFWSKSPLATSEEVNKIFFGAEQWTSYRDNIEDWNKVRDALFNQIKAADKKLYDTSMRQEFGDNYDPTGKYAQIFEQSYNEFGDVTKASTAARSAYTADKLAAEQAKKAQEEAAAAKKVQQATAPAASATSGNSEAVVTRFTNYESNAGYHWRYAVYSDGSKNKINYNVHVWNHSTGKCTICGRYDASQKTNIGKGNGYSIGGVGEKGTSTIMQRASGGYVNHGIYELGERGTETVLTASQTKVLRDNILSNRPSSLISLLKTYNEGFSQNHFDAYGKEIQTLYNNTSNDSCITIENATVNMNVQQLANDYDAKRAGEQALAEIMRIARKTSANNSIRR